MAAQTTPPQKRIVKAHVRFLSLCRKGRNLMPALYKSEDGASLQVETVILKGSPEQVERGELLAVVYSPNRLDVDREWADSEVIKSMAYSFAEEGLSLDNHHDEQPISRDDAYVAESFLIQKGDPRFVGVKDRAGNSVDVSGGWGVVIMLKSERFRQHYRDGDWDGVSMGGRAARRAEPLSKGDKTMALTAEEKDDLIKSIVREIRQPSPEDQRKTLVKDVADEVKKAIGLDFGGETKPPKPGADPQAPMFKGNPRNAAEVRAHKKALADYNLTKGVDWTDEASVAAYEDKLAKAEQDEKASRASAQTGALLKADGQGVSTGDLNLDSALLKGQSIGKRLANLANGKPVDAK